MKISYLLVLLSVLNAHAVQVVTLKEITADSVERVPGLVTLSMPSAHFSSDEFISSMWYFLDKSDKSFKMLFNSDSSGNAICKFYLNDQEAKAQDIKITTIEQNSSPELFAITLNKDGQLSSINHIYKRDVIQSVTCLPRSTPLGLDAFSIFQNLDDTFTIIGPNVFDKTEQDYDLGIIGMYGSISSNSNLDLVCQTLFQNDHLSAISSSSGESCEDVYYVSSIDKIEKVHTYSVGNCYEKAVSIIICGRQHVSLPETDNTEAKQPVTNTEVKTENIE